MINTELSERKRFIAIDLELEQSNANPQVNDSKLPDNATKIIQLGFVVVEIGETPTFLHEEVIHLYYDKPLSTFIKELTSINDDDVTTATDDAKSCLVRLKHIREQYQASRQLLEWGGGDTKALEAESFCCVNKDFGFARSSINVKHLFQMYCLANGSEKKGGLSSSMKKLNIPFVSTRYKGQNKGSHWALTDAKNTAIIFNELIKLLNKNNKKELTII